MRIGKVVRVIDVPAPEHIPIEEPAPAKEPVEQPAPQPAEPEREEVPA